MRLVLLSAALLPVLGLPVGAQSLPTSMLEGCWERTASNNRRFAENWMVLDGRLVGVAQAIASTGSRDIEQLRVYRDGGALVYDAHPGTQARTRFTSKDVASARLVFENLAHDFPQRIIYERRGDSLFARVEGMRNGQLAGIDYRFAKMACGPTPVSPTMLARLALEAKYEDIRAKELATIAARLEWFADNAAAGYTYVTWAAPGSDVAIWDVEALRRVAGALRTNIGQLNPTDRAFDVSVDRVLLRADTAEVMASARQSYKFTDAAGRFGTAGAEHTRSGVQRWMDVWVKRGDSWSLQATRLFSDEALMDGKVTVRDGRPVTP